VKALALSLLVLAGTVPAAAPPRHEFIEAVEFPYYLCPRTLWERELVWMKTIGVRTVEFSVPWNWHQVRPGEYDLTGTTSPRRDLVGFIKLLRRLDLHAWVRPLPPVAGWLNDGVPAAGSETRAQREWLKQLERLLATQTVKHGGPVAYVEGRLAGVDATEAPAHVMRISADEKDALAKAREVLASGSGAVLWTDVEDALYPAGWSADPAVRLRKGAVGFNGEERPAAASVRRNAALLRNWSNLVAAFELTPMPAAKFPEGVSGLEAISAAGSAVSISNRSGQEFHDDLKVIEPVSRRVLMIPEVTVPAGESLWLPLAVSLGTKGLCRECSNFSSAEQIVYATAELQTVEFENGILAMEFSAPVAGEAILQLARKPVGPYLAGGSPAEFDWDDKTLRTRLRIPAGKGPAHRVRVGLAIEEPETSAFFNDAHRLVIGQKNLVSTSYSSEDLAKRSRLRLPEGFTATPTVKSPVEIDYQIAVPPDQLHGAFMQLGIEADGNLLGRAMVQLFRPVSVHLVGAAALHFGGDSELPVDPPLAVVDPQVGASLEISLRNNYPGIQTFHLDASGAGLGFSPAKTEISVAAADERKVTLHVLPADTSATGLRDWRLHVTTPAGDVLDLPMRVLLLPRRQTVAWSADLDGDGSPEWVLESTRARAVFSAQDGGRWMEFVWKDANWNVVAQQGVFSAAGPVEVEAAGDHLEIRGKGWKRTVRLVDNALTVEQDSPLPADSLAADKRNNLNFTVTRESPARVTYSFQ
jgi:hypothetical protein